VRLAGEVVAVIDVESDRLAAFDEGDVVAIDAIAAQIASAIRNARLFEEKVRALRNLEILQEITNVLNSELDLDALLDRIARRSVEAVRPAQMGAVLLYDNDALRVRSSYGYPHPQAFDRVRLAFHEGLPGTVFVSGHGRVAVFTPGDHGRHGEAFREAAGDVDPTSALCVPICLPKEKLGVLLLENVTSPEAFDADDLLFALTLADQAAIAIGNALRLRKILELDQHRKEYLSNVSHELRTPLTVIQGYVEALVDGTAGDQSDHFLRVARDQCQRLGRLIEEILEVSRLEHGVAQRHLEWGSVALGATLRRVLMALRQDLIVKRLHLYERVSTELPALRGDERLLHLLLLNLVENAVKFTPEGGTIDVALEAVADEIVLTIADTGIGIPPELHERIFEKFFTVHAGLTRSHGGTGIGLYLVKEVVAIHKGAIRVESPAAGGTRFEVRLPVGSEV
jgi:signal transduction histidine kinase